MHNPTFSKQCEDLLAAEKRRDALKTCIDNLPADEKYDLQMRVEWAWGASMPGYKEMQFAVRKRFDQALRLTMCAALKESENEVLLARSAVVNYARGIGQ